MDSGGGGASEDARARITRLAAELDSLAPPDDMPGMILSGNAVRRSEYLEAANRKQSEMIAAYEEHTAQLEGLVAAALEVQSELTEIVRLQSEMIPDVPGRGKSQAGGGRGGRAGRAAAAAAGSRAKSQAGGGRGGRAGRAAAAAAAAAAGSRAKSQAGGGRGGRAGRAAAAAAAAGSRAKSQAGGGRGGRAGRAAAAAGSRAKPRQGKPASKGRRGR